MFCSAEYNDTKNSAPICLLSSFIYFIHFFSYRIHIQFVHNFIPQLSLCANLFAI